MRRLTTVAMLTLLTTAAQGQVSARAALLTADLDLSATVYRDGAVATFPNALGDNGVLVWPAAAVLQGKAAALPFFARQPLLSGMNISWQPFRIEVAPDSSLAIMVGVAIARRPAIDPFPEIGRIGRYIEVWMRANRKWELAAFALVNVFTSNEVIWNDFAGQRELPLLRSTGPAAAFIAADSMFAADAGASGASKAFAKWAAPDGVTFAQTGELNTGPARIAAVLASNTAHWEWGAVAAGASADGTLGWTVGQATITPANGSQPSKSKYLTLWRKMPDGTIRFIADGGNARP